MRRDVVEWTGLGRYNNRRGLGLNHNRRDGNTCSVRRRKAGRLLCQDHPVIVVISRCDLRAVFQVATVMMRRQPRAQRHEDEEQDTR